MITIEIYKKLRGTQVASLTITDRMTLVVGDSGTGKSHICEMLSPKVDNAYTYKAYDNKKNSIRVNYCSDIERLSEILSNTKYNKSVIVMDEYLASELNKLENSKIRGKIDKYIGYFIIFQRDNIIKYHIGVNSVFKVIRKDGIYKFDKALKTTEVTHLGELTACEAIIVEDSKSGFNILKHYMNTPNKMQVDHSTGNGDIDKKIREYENCGIICGLDYDKGSWQVYNIYKLVNNGNLKVKRLYFINMESFEEILCNSELVLSKNSKMVDYVRNIEKHMNCTFSHRGEYYLTLLNLFFVDDVNNRHPKYAKNKIKCFIQECKDCTHDSCRFRQNDIEKASIVFSNKYKILYDLYKYLKQ